ncbi:MAG: cyclic-di-AMP receptor [Limnochordia bacterium]
MKLIVAVIQDEDAVPLMKALTAQKHRATKLASTGGFLLRGNTTLMIGVQDDEVDSVLEIISTVCRRRSKHIPQLPTEIAASVSLPIEAEIGGAIVFVVDVERFVRI